MNRFRTTCSILFLLFMFEATFSQVTVNSVHPCRCKMSVYKRLRCPLTSPDVSAEACQAQGCCYDATTRWIYFFSVAPKCFRATGDCAAEKCQVPTRQRQSCGFFHRYACQRRGCCYDYRSNPRCYRASGRIIGPAGEQPELIATAAPISGRREFVSWSTWGQWGACSQTCAPGSRTRSRQCLRGDRQVLEAFCGQSLPTESGSCNSNLCQSWSEWAEVGRCSVTCGGEGTVNLTRRCIGSGEESNNSCSSRARRCSTPDCPVEPSANWAPWGPWSRCLSRCRPGVSHRTRLCLRGDVVVSGNSCFGTGLSSRRPDRRAWETKRCNVHMCTVWSPFSLPQPCPAGCSDNVTVQVSSRHCLSGGGDALTDAERRDFAMCSTVTQICPWVRCETEQPTTNTFIPHVSEATASIVEGTALPSLSTSNTSAWEDVTSALQTTARTTETTAFKTTSDISSAHSTTTQQTDATVMENVETTQTVTVSKTTTQTMATTTITTDDPPTAPIQSLGGRVTSFLGLVTSSTATSDMTSTTELATMAVTSPEMTYLWSEWSPCSRSCGPGIQTRFKTCYDGTGSDVSHNVTNCAMGQVRGERRCNSHLCPMWASWGPTFCLEDCKLVNNRLKTSTRNLTRDCKVKVSDKGDDKCYKKSLICSAFCPTPTATSPTLTSPTPTSQWSEWGEWSSCSEECAPGSRTRSRTCSVTSQCTGNDVDSEPCNVDHCKTWSEWSSSTCSDPCGGNLVSQRRCLDNGTVGNRACRERSEACRDDEACQGDDVMDFLFLVDSSDYVDNCKEMKRNGSKIPVESEFINNETTPVNYKMREFMKSFAEGWKTSGNVKTRIAVQLISGVCKSKAKHHFYLMRNFTDLDEEFKKEVDSLPYLCGQFWLDWALRCTTKNVLTPSSGDRPNVPTVVVALLSYVPPLSRPSNFLLSAISQGLANKGVPVVTASVTPPEKMSSLGRSKHDQMLRTLSCRYAANCPLYIGSIWDDSGESPAQRIRHALSYYAFI